MVPENTIATFVAAAVVSGACLVQNIAQELWLVDLRLTQRQFEKVMEPFELADDARRAALESYLAYERDVRDLSQASYQRQLEVGLREIEQSQAAYHAELAKKTHITEADREWADALWWKHRDYEEQFHERVFLEAVAAERLAVDRLRALASDIGAVLGGDETTRQHVEREFRRAILLQPSDLRSDFTPPDLIRVVNEAVRSGDIPAPTADPRLWELLTPVLDRYRVSIDGVLQAMVADRLDGSRARFRDADRRARALDDRRKRANQRHAINDAALSEMLIAIDGAGLADSASRLSARYHRTLAPRLHAPRWDSVATKWMEQIRSEGLVDAAALAHIHAFLTSHQSKYARQLEEANRLGMEAAREAGSIYFMDSPVSKRYAEAALALGHFNLSQWERFTMLARDTPGFAHLLSEVLDPATGSCRSDLMGPYHTAHPSRTLKGDSQ